MPAAPPTPGQHVQEVDVAAGLGELWQFVVDAWNAFDVAGLPDVLGVHHGEHGNFHGVLTGIHPIDQHMMANVFGANGEFWNDDAGKKARDSWSQLMKGNKAFSDHFEDKTKALGDFHGQVNNFNDCLHETFVTIAVSIAISVASAWFPATWVVSGAAATNAAVATDRAWGIVRTVQGVLNLVKTVFSILKGTWAIITDLGGFFSSAVEFFAELGPNLLKLGPRLLSLGIDMFNAARANPGAVLFNFADTMNSQAYINFFLRFGERLWFAGDPTYAWSPFDFNQLWFATFQNVLLNSFLTGPGVTWKTFNFPWQEENILGRTPTYGPGGLWSTLDGTDAAFLRSSWYRTLQAGGTATLYNFVNHMAFQSQGFNFNIPLSLERGTGFTLLINTLIIGGNLVFYLGYPPGQGTSGLPQELTIPLVIGLSGTADLFIPGVREAKGLVFVTSADNARSGQTGPDIVGQQTIDQVKKFIQGIQHDTGIQPQAQTQTVGATDTLIDLAQRQYGKWNDKIIADILKYNGLSSPSDIQPGQKLNMPLIPASDYQ